MKAPTQCLKDLIYVDVDGTFFPVDKGHVDIEGHVRV